MPFERVTTCWRFSVWLVRKGGATGRPGFVRHPNGRWPRLGRKSDGVGGETAGTVFPPLPPT
ncbi:hypothetical protein SSCG_04357 [Streptomyces clavuligerus]|nr:hypothetical protein SSCG_04357 [Streptomyces clavuligerus]